MRINIRAARFLIVLLALAGLGLMMASPLSNWYWQRSFRREIEEYDQFAGIDCDAMWRAAEAYNRDLAARGDLRTLSEEEEAERTAGLLDPWGTGMMGYLEIPKIDVSLPIYQGTGETALQAGAGHWQGSSLPVGGSGSHCVLTGHNGLIKAKMFTDLDQLELGDTFTLSVLDRVMTYQVDQILVTDPSDLEPLAIEEGRDYVTLYTCTPYGVNTHRLLVRGTRVEASPQASADGGELIKTWMPLGGAVLLCTVFLAFLRKPARKKPAGISCGRRGRTGRFKPGKEELRMRKRKTWFQTISCLLLGALLLTQMALAAGGVLILRYRQEGVGFQIYRVAEKKGGAYVLTGAFTEYQVEISDGNWRDAAMTLAAYAARDQLPAAAYGRISNGTVTFRSLEAGLYLVTGETSYSGGAACTPVPFLIQVSEAGTALADVKYEIDSSPEEHEIDLKVKKVWVWDGDQTLPDDVTVQLLHNEKLYDTAVLNDSNDWAHTWTGLDSHGRWQVTEETVPESCSVSVSRSGNTFTVTNTLSGDITDPVIPDVPDTPDTPDGPYLPQTGQLWAPVLILLACGGTMVLAGQIKRRKEQR